MKNILILAKSLGGGGSEVALVELINKLDTEYCNIDLVLLDKDSEFENRLNKKINIRYLEFEKKYYHRLVSLYCLEGRALKKFKANSYVRYYDWLFNKVITKFKSEYDIAIDFYGYGYFFTGYLAKKINSHKKATWLHDEKIDWLKNTIMYFDKIDNIYGVSKTVVEKFCETYPQFKDKTDTFYNVIDTKKILEKASELCVLGKEYNILTVGRLVEQKGYDIAIQAAKILKDNHIKFKWYSIGKGKDENKLKKMVENLNLQNEFLFLGQMENPYTYMKNCDLYIQPSRHEGYGLTLVEARVLCKPIIASDIATSREQIRNNETGFLVKLDGKALAGKIMEVYNDNKKIEKVVFNLKNETIDFDKEIEKLYE